MPTHNFLLSDCLAIPGAFFLFSVIAFLPGYAAGWLSDVLRFRRRSLAFRLCASVPLALAIGPAAAYTLGRLLSLTAVLVGYGLLSGYSVYLAIGVDPSDIDDLCR